MIFQCTLGIIVLRVSSDLARFVVSVVFRVLVVGFGVSWLSTFFVFLVVSFVCCFSRRGFCGFHCHVSSLRGLYFAFDFQ